MKPPAVHLEVQARRLRAKRLKLEAEYRRRDRAAGVWPRLVAQLARTESGWAVNGEVTASLEERGYGPHPIGRTLPASDGGGGADFPRQRVAGAGGGRARGGVVLVPFSAS